MDDGVLVELVHGGHDAPDILERMVSGATQNNRLHELLVWNWKSAREANTSPILARWCRTRR